MPVKPRLAPAPVAGAASATGAEAKTILEVFIMAMMYRFPWWPFEPFWGAKVFLVLLVIAGVIFTIAMLIDCLKRPASKFVYPLTKNGEYDRLIWAAAIFLSLGFYFAGAIVYFFVVNKAKPDGSV